MLVVLAAALLHAAWNAHIKASRDKFIDTVLLVIGSGVSAALLLFVLPMPAPASWLFLAASAVIHAVYFCLVAFSYRTGDLSFAYPLMRGSAPLFTALVAALLVGEHIGVGGWVGIVLLCAGILWMARGTTRSASHHPHALLFPLVTASAIVLYTIVDGLGARAAQNPFSYLVWMSFLTTFPVLALALLWRREALMSTPVRGWFKGLAGGVLSAGAYGLVLWAMTQAPIALVAALRETSVLFGTALGALVLKERFGYERWIAAVLITIGAVAIKVV